VKEINLIVGQEECGFAECILSEEEYDGFDPSTDSIEVHEYSFETDAEITAFVIGMDASQQDWYMFITEEEKIKINKAQE